MRSDIAIPDEKGNRLGHLGSDIFSHRFFGTSSVGEIQFQVHCEGLVREYTGKVSSREWYLTTQVNGDPLEILTSLFSTYSPTAYVDGNSTKYFFGKTWAVKLFWTPVTSAKSKKIRDLVAIVVSSNTSFQTTLFSALVEQGFKVLTDLESTDDTGIAVTFAFPTQQGIDYRTRSFKELPLSTISNNYTPELIKQVKDLIAKISGVTSGIVLLGGPVGTGKSYLIRSLLTELAERRAIVCSPASYFLRSAGILTEVLTRFEKSIIVFEDVGGILEMDSPLQESDQRSNLLNLSEGLLSLLADSIIVLSFNHEPSKIDPAVWRPGRCLKYLRVGNLSYEMSESWLGDASKLLEKREYSLAELYELKRGGTLSVAVSGSRKVGLLR